MGRALKTVVKNRGKSAASRKPKERNLEATRQRILTVAFETFFKQGFQGTSMDDLVRKTSLTKGAFYHQFATKYDLGYAVVDEVLTELILNRWIRPLAGFANPVEGILKLMQQNIGDTPPEHLRYGCPLNNMVQEMAPVDKGFGRRLQAALDLWVNGLDEHLKRGQQSGFIRPDADTLEAAHFIVMAHEGFYGFIKGLNSPNAFAILLASMEKYFQSLRP